MSICVRTTSFALLIAWFGFANMVSADRKLVHETIVPAPIADVWAAFTTAEGFKSWAVPKAEIDFRVGGDMRTSYNPDSTLSDEHTIVNRILAYEPERMLAMQNVQAPAGLPNSELFQLTWSVVYFTRKSEKETHIRMVGLGYGQGPEWDMVYNMFKDGNAYSLEKLRERFAPAEATPEAGDGKDQPQDISTDKNESSQKPTTSIADSTQSDSSTPGAKTSDGSEMPAEPTSAAAKAEDPTFAFQLLSRLVGGEWINEMKVEDGKIFRARSVMSRGPDGVSLASNSWLGDGDGMVAHGKTIIYRQPETGVPHFFNVDERGTVAQGAIQSLLPDTLQWDWNSTSLDGSRRSLVAIIKFTDNDHYQFSVTDTAKPAAQPSVTLEFARVGKAPEAFLKLKTK